jgi:ATP-binding cassette subfamily B protein
MSVSACRHLQRRSTTWKSWRTSCTIRSASRTAKGAAPIRVIDGEIVFDRVTFHYGSHRDAALSRLLGRRSKPGERVGLVGHSGSGKTTFVKLIQRLYDVTGGRILIDGQDIANATQASLRQQIAIVQQEPILFHRSLAENIAYGDPAQAGRDRGGGEACQCA